MINRSEKIRLSATDISRKYKLPTPLAEILITQEIDQDTDIESYLNPRLDQLPDPFSLKGITRAVELILQAREKNETIAIHGDYDVDGITSTVLLVDFLRKMDMRVHYFIPNRLKEGYGLSNASIDKIADKAAGKSLLITVDCGISSYEEIQYANELGYKVIVTDHHIVPENLPLAESIINPKQPGCTFTYKELSGAGVVFFLLMALRRKMVETGAWIRQKSPNLKDYLDLVALGTIADVVSLTGINRILVKAGLEVMGQQKREGIKALCASAGIESTSEVSSTDISFKLAPRINATGRLGKPDIAAKLLLSKEQKAAQKQAVDVEMANNERKEIEKTVLENAIKQAKKQIDENKNGLVLYNAEWHEGVIGIIAARIVDLYKKPTVILTSDSANKLVLAKGSGRSTPGVNIYTILSRCDNAIDQFGGHPMAAGLSLEVKKINRFKNLFNKHSTAEIQKKCKMEHSSNEIIIQNNENCWSLCKGLKKMEPFGQGNPEPIFILNNACMTEVEKLREHLRYTITIGGHRIHGIGFFMVEKYSLIKVGPVKLGMKIRTSTFRGRERLESQAVFIESTS